MERRTFFKTAALAGLAAPFAVQESAGYAVTHSWDRYDFGLDTNTQSANWSFSWSDSPTTGSPAFRACCAYPW